MNTLVKEQLKFEVLKMPLGENTLHMMRINTHDRGTPVFMLHGAVENGTIFYSRTGKGLAAYLAMNGYDVFVADLRGHGLSTPGITRESDFGQTEHIMEDITVFVEKIIELRGFAPQIWVAHSWGGVFMSAHLVRVPRHRELVKAGVYLGTKRRVTVWNMARFIQLDFWWGFLAKIVTRLYGYLPMKDLGLFLGDDNETKKCMYESDTWLRSKEWFGADGFNYTKAIGTVTLPPILYMSASKDAWMGNKKDMRRFMDESRQNNGAFLVIGKKEGFKNDYNHITMLTHREASQDHFPAILEWLSKADGQEEVSTKESMINQECTPNTVPSL